MLAVGDCRVLKRTAFCPFQPRVGVLVSMGVLSFLLTVSWYGLQFRAWCTELGSGSPSGFGG